MVLVAMVSFVINSKGAAAQEETAPPLKQVNRDPFIPLVDDKGNLRRDFKKTSRETIAPQVVLMGISKVGNAFYALIDGELVKEGQVFKDMRVEKIYSDRVIVFYGDKAFQLKWEADKTK